jgi:hypothetical protein
MPEGRDHAETADVTDAPNTTDAAAAPAVIACAMCGATPDDMALARLTWARGTENGHEVWTCDTCSRRHLRSIEGKLDSSWW